MMYTAAIQTRYNGNGWRYSTRATEGRGARYKTYMRKVVCRRKGIGIAKIRRAVRQIDQLRPLEVSLSAAAIAERLLIPLETVMVACLILSQQHDTLHFDEVPPFGWVLSESAH